MRNASRGRSDPRSEPAGVTDARLAARQAGLRYASDAQPGITRRRSGHGFSYRDADGRTIRDRDELSRIKRLAVPPAWTEVWICPYPTGHIQATGRDARGRKQYRYHPDWRRRRDRDKFGRMLEFANALPAIRTRCDADLALAGLPRDKVLAAVVRLLELTMIRVGNEAYARLNRSFGLTTLRGRHAHVEGSQIRFRFRGKTGRMIDVDLRDRRLAAIVRRCQELPGQELFQFVDPDGAVQDVTSDDVNAYLRDVSGRDFTAKDFRTWAGTIEAFRALRRLEPAEDQRALNQNVGQVIRETADQLGNTPRIARMSYVHPAVVDGYLDGSLRARRTRKAGDSAPTLAGPDPVEERALIVLLRREARRASRRAPVCQRSREGKGRKAPVGQAQRP
jgi:DNA topoisomerase-1